MLSLLENDIKDINDIDKKVNNKYYAVKIFFENINPSLIEHEILILQYISIEFEKLKKNINYCDIEMIKIYDGYTNGKETYVILPFIEHVNFYEFYKKASIKSIKYYIKSLLENIINLEYLGIVHRDVKPDNFLYNDNLKKGVLIDYGLATIVDNTNILSNLNFNYNNLYNSFIKLNTSNNKRVGTRGFISPEQYFENHELKNKININSKYDVWSIGIILFYFFSHKLLKIDLIKDNASNSSINILEELLPLILVNTKESINKFVKDFDINLYLPKLIIDNIGKIELKDMFVRDDIDDLGIDFLKNLLCIDINKRLSPTEAYKHNWLKEVV